MTTAAGEMRLATKGRGVVEIKPDWKMQLMSAITDPNIALILLMIGIYGILFEFWSPGAVAPGVIGGISLIVALTALSVLPVNLGGLALLASRHRPDGGRGISAPASASPGWAGSSAFVVGALFLFDPAEADIPIRVSWQVIAGMAILSAGFFIGMPRLCRPGAPAPGAHGSRADDRQHRRGRELGRRTKAASRFTARSGRRGRARASPRARRCASSAARA